MPVELRKRKAPAPPPEPPAKKASKVTKAVAKVKDAIVKPRGRPPKAAPAEANGKPETAPAAATGKPEVGATISLDGFGGEIQKHDGTKTTLKALVDESKAGVVLFTYPKASTPGCTKQACLFRDSYESLTAGGLAIYGLSTDSPKANTSFKENKKLPYPLLCDPSATLIGAIGLKKAPKGTTRGVFVIDKSGKVLASQPGSPDGTFDVVKKIVGDLPGSNGVAESAPPMADKVEAEPASSAPEPEKIEKAEEVEKPVEEQAAEEPAEEKKPAEESSAVKPAEEKAAEEKLIASPAPAPAPVPAPAAAVVEESSEKKDVEMTDAPNGDVKAAEEKPEAEKKEE